MAQTIHLSIADLFSTLKTSTDEQTALTISKAFEVFMAEQAMQMKKAKQEVIEEMHTHDFATKKDLLDLEIKLYKEISSSKWQVIGSVAAMLFVELVLRHFGI